MGVLYIAMDGQQGATSRGETGTEYLVTLIQYSTRQQIVTKYSVPVSPRDVAPHDRSEELEDAFHDFASQFLDAFPD